MTIAAGWAVALPVTIDRCKSRSAVIKAAVHLAFPTLDNLMNITKPRVVRAAAYVGDSLGSIIAFGRGKALLRPTEERLALSSTACTIVDEETQR